METKQPISEHPHNKAKDQQQMGGMIFLVPLFVIAYVVLQKLNFGIPEEFVIMVAIMIPASIWGISISVYRLWLKPRVDVFQNGLRYTTRREVKFWAWESVEELRALRPWVSQTGQYGLYINNKRVLLLNDRFQRGADLVNHALVGLVRARGYDDHLKAGKTLRAGELTIHQDGLQVKKRPVIRWSEIRGIYQERHFSQVRIERTHGRSIKLKTQQIPDAPLLTFFASQTLESLAHHPETAPVTAVDKPELAAKTHLRASLSVLQLLLAIAALGFSLSFIIPGINNAITYDFVDSGWLLQLGQALIVPAISMIVLVRESRALIENPRFVANHAGLTRHTRSGERFWPWQDIDSIGFVKSYAWFLPNARPAYGFEKDSRRLLTLDNRFAKFGDLGLTALSRHAAAVYPQYKQRFQQGEMLNFGPISVDLVGVHAGKKTHPWSDIKSSDVLKIGNETHLIIYGPNDKQLFTKSIFGIRSFQILQGLLQERITGDTPKFDAIIHSDPPAN